MSARERVRLGQFLSRRDKDPDDPADLLAPGGVLDPDKSFLEINLPSDSVVASIRASLPEMDPPPLTEPGRHGLGPTPSLTPMAQADTQPSLATTPSPPPASQPSLATTPMPPPAGPIVVADPPRVPIAGSQPSQGLETGPAALPAPPAFAPEAVPAIALQAAPGGDPNATLPVMPPPTLSSPLVLPLQPPPDLGGQYAPGGALPPGTSPLDSLASADQRIITFLREVGGDQYAEHLGFPFGGQGDLALSPDLYAQHIDRVGQDLGKLAIHTGIQLALFLQNDKGRIWNPALIAPPPIAINFLSPALDIGLVMTPPVANRDIHKEMAEGTYSVDRITSGPPFVQAQAGIGGGSSGPLGALSDILGSGQPLVGALSQQTSIVDDPAGVTIGMPLVRAGLEQRNLHTSDTPYSEHAVPKMSDLVDAALDKKPSPFLTDDTKTVRYMVSSKRDPQKLAGMFEPERRKVTSAYEWRSKAGLARDKGKDFSNRLDAAAFPNGVIPAKVRGENDFGFAVSDSGRPPSVDDDDAYVPVSFTDLRPISGLKYRTVYFRPFNITLSEDLSPQWNKANFMGRTDAVATYMATARSFNIGFQLQAFSPEDVRTIYQKLHWLTSMVYPEYDRDLILKSGPVSRVRVGDVMNALGPEGTRGLPGIIESLNFDYSDSLWELKRDWKVPVGIKVTCGFTVLHDKPIGRGGLGKFGGIGSIKDGLYLPPSMADHGPVEGSRDFVQMDDNDRTFRSIGGDNSYTLENILFDDSEK